MATVGVLSALVLAIASTAWWRPTAELDALVIATGGSGGVYYPYGQGVAEMARSDSAPDAEVLETAASIENLRLVDRGDADLAFTLADAAALAVTGADPYNDPLPVSALARPYDNRTHLVVRADVPVDTASELDGRRVSVGALGSGTEMIAERVLELSGLDPHEDIERSQLSVDSSAQAIIDDRIDAFFWSGGLPTRAVVDLADHTDIRLVDLAELVPMLREEHGEVYTEATVPSQTYPGVPEVRTIGVPNLLVVRTDMAQDQAYGLTRLLFEHRGRLAEEHHQVALQLNPRQAISTRPLDLHPGAASYYREQKEAH
ncbi:TAXI family TRAP transporter solute-binding subunit [Lipingzhangella rawalii]|uniref:TAXI family TRAP transporter solute-binding subunit n=1 Tax=Lipingzhangella rawalii TaxID=2055835 RepID=UPI00287BC5C4|nr:TAXI family TRAP transporter solute-binding subunit [Lipingzhangella rawalii]